MANRLKLDFSLTTSIERAEFIQQYLEEDQFKTKRPTKEELEMCGNYILWGKDFNGLNAVQRKEIEIKTKNKTWEKKKEESLDALVENPSFNENTIMPANYRPKVVREVFSREKALRDAPEDIKEVLVSLFKQIDELEIIINFYDIKIGKRTTPPRKALLEVFSDEELSHLQTRADKLGSMEYLKNRHYLVELRRQQYSLKDLYSPLIQKEFIHTVMTIEQKLDFESEVEVFPLGLIGDSGIWKKIFKDFGELDPRDFGEEELKRTSEFYWGKINEHTKIWEENIERKRNNARPHRYFDFRELEHVYQLFLQFYEVGADQTDIEVLNKELLDTLDYYIRQAELTPLYREILRLKINKVKNQDIVVELKKNFGKSYTPNYISTIFRQKIIPAINNAASLHERVIGSIFFEEDFKRCNTCGKLLLRDGYYFVKKTRAKDGFTNRCKKCDKEKRLSGKTQVRED